MFYLINVIRDACVAVCDDRNALHIAWLKHVQKIGRYDYQIRHERNKTDFSQLSMNDNDVTVNRHFRLRGYNNHGDPIYDYIVDCMPRQFRVLDENGRAIDIREWPEMYEEPQWPAYNFNFCCTGSKNHSHRITGPAFGRQMKMEIIIDEDDLPAHIQENKLQYRKRTQLGGWRNEEYYDRKACKKYGKKNWKDNTRAKHQWAKHKRKPDYMELNQIQYDDSEPENILDDVPIYEPTTVFVLGNEYVSTN